MKMVDFLVQMKHDPIRNYGGIPGLTSWMIAAPGIGGGMVRLMECSRDHQEPIIPHSHRFDFHCIVLAGDVRQVLWEMADAEDEDADWFQQSVLEFSGKPGKYTRSPAGVYRFKPRYAEYHKGDEYGMKADEIHSIYFSRGTSVLFFEGPEVSQQRQSVILEPWVNGKVVPTFRVEPWMFEKEAVK